MSFSDIVVDSDSGGRLCYVNMTVLLLWIEMTFCNSFPKFNLKISSLLYRQISNDNHFRLFRWKGCYSLSQFHLKTDV